MNNLEEDVRLTSPWIRSYHRSEKWQIVIMTFILSAMLVRIWSHLILAPDIPLIIFFIASFLSLLVAMSKALLIWKLEFRKSAALIKGRSVDVFITTVNEPVSLLEVTVTRCKSLNYPHQTYILDDGRRKEVEELARKLDVGYITREDRRAAKAGNLNHALKLTSGEFFCVFDADGLPSKDFIDVTLGYFSDGNVAIVQSHQFFYNLNGFHYSHDHVKSFFWSEQSYFFDILMTAKDSSKSSMWCGNGAILRRKHIEEIGGISESTLTEDFDTTLLLAERGREIVYYPVPKCMALAPVGYKAFLTQRLRWQTGVLQTLIKRYRFFLNFKLPWRLRLGHFMNCIYNLEAIILCLYLVLPVLMIFQKVHFSNYYDYALLPLTFAIIWRLENYVSLKRLKHYREFNLLKMLPFIWNMALFTTGLKRYNFEVTSKSLRSEESTLYTYAYWLLGGILLSTLSLHSYNFVLNADMVESLPFFFSAFAFCLWVSALLFLDKRMRPENLPLLKSLPISMDHGNGRKSFKLQTFLISSSDIGIMGDACLKKGDEVILNIPLNGKTITCRGRVSLRSLSNDAQSVFKVKILDISEGDRDLLDHFIAGSFFTSDHLPANACLT